MGTKYSHSLEVKNNLQMFNKLLVLREIRGDPGFKPNKDDGSFKTWAQKGLSIFGQFLNDKGIVTIVTFLQKEYGLPHTHFFRYLQVTSYIENSDMQNKTL